MDDRVTQLLLSARLKTWDGQLTCADCSSLGLDSAVGRGPMPKSGSCSSCGEVWPKRPDDFHTRQALEREKKAKERLEYICTRWAGTLSRLAK
jgi:hypothetical protein